MICCSRASVSSKLHESRAAFCCISRAEVATQIGFTDITDIITEAVDEHLAQGHVDDAHVGLDDVLAADTWGRERAAELCVQHRIHP